MGRKLYVGNLPYSATEQSVRDAFSKCGTVSSVSIISDRDTGQSKGFGFVEMPNDAEAREAIRSMNGGDYYGNRILVSEAKEDAGGGNRGGFGGSNHRAKSIKW